MMLLAHMSFLSNVSVPASRKFLLAFKEPKRACRLPLSGPYEDDPICGGNIPKVPVLCRCYHILYEVEKQERLY